MSSFKPTNLASEVYHHRIEPLGTMQGTSADYSLAKCRLLAWVCEADRDKQSLLNHRKYLHFSIPESFKQRNSTNIILSHVRETAKYFIWKDRMNFKEERTKRRAAWRVNTFTPKSDQGGEGDKFAGPPVMGSLKTH